MKLQCPECDRRLRLSDEQRVRTVRCPKCNAIFSVVEPVRDEGVAIKDDPSLPSPGPPAKGQVERRSSREPATSQSSADLAWELKIADGRVFGPVDRPTLDQWIREGYVGIDCWLRRSTNREWQPRMAAANGSRLKVSFRICEPWDHRLSKRGSHLVLRLRST